MVTTATFTYIAKKLALTMKNKAITVISKIGMDHAEFLGSTIREIAAMKAGIMVEGVPCVHEYVWSNIYQSCRNISYDRIFSGRWTWICIGTVHSMRIAPR